MSLQPLNTEDVGRSLTIAVCADDLRIDTSSTPSRDMVRELVRLRSEDRFVFVMSADTAREDWCSEYFESLPEGRWSIHIERHSRRTKNLAKLLGLGAITGSTADADLYIRFEMGTFGPGRRPLIALITDLSAIRRPQGASLRWHGRLLFRRGIRETLEAADRIVAISEFSRKDLIAFAPASEPLLRVIPNGLAAAWYQEGGTAGDSSDVPEMEGPGYFIWYGQVTPRKNIRSLIRAYGQLFRAMAGTACPELVIVGRFLQGDAGIRELVDSLRLNGKVRFFPPQPLAALVELVSGSKGLVFPSFYEGFGMPVVEAMARGRPVLTSNCSAMPEVAGGHAVLCSPEDIDSIAAGMAGLLEEDQWRPEAVVARKAWAGSFTAKAAAMRYNALIEKLLEQKVPDARSE